MKKQFKNSDIQNICGCLQIIGSRKGNMSERWKLALKSEPFLRKQELVSMKCQELVEAEGTTDANGNKSLSPKDAKYMELMSCESEVEYESISLQDLQEAGINELLILKELIVDV